MNKKSSVRLEGTVRSLNYSPKGTFEGLLLDSDGEVSQINFDPKLSQEIAEAAPPGTQVSVEAEKGESRGKAPHAVYELISLTGKDGASVGSEEGTFSGKVARLNYALHGEVNGAILESGDFVHVKPHGAESLGLEEGMQVEGTGERKRTIDGHWVIEASEVNGLSIEGKPKPKPKKKAAHAH
jgi:hypothetical protein